MTDLVDALRRVKLSKQNFLAIVIGLALFNVIVYLRFQPSTSKLKANTQQLISIFDGVHHRDSKLANVRTRLEVYDEIFSQITMYDFLNTQLYEGRCLVYFNHLSMSMPDWLINPHESVDVDTDSFSSFEEYEIKRLKEFNKKVTEAEENGFTPPTKPTVALMKKDYNLIVNRMKKDEQLIHDFVSHVRVFDRCYLSGYTSESGQSKSNFVSQQRNFISKTINFQPSPEEAATPNTIYESPVACSEIEQKIFPFISREFPVFTRWDGSVHFFPNSKYSGLPNRECFLNDFRQRINGKGIVLTVGDGQVTDASRLIRILRYFRNTYPIQILYHTSLSEESKGRLKDVAREAFHDLPPQDLWFVDTKRSIKPAFLNKFHGFANKMLAMLFNSFEEILFLDADAALLKDPSYFFALKKYVEKGAYFYRDRAAQQSRGLSDIKFFMKMMPSIEDSIVFNIDQVSNYTLNNGFFNGMGHYMESGIVVLNRKKHFIQPLMLSVISFYHPVNGRVYGDKEMFWLAVAISGRNDYHFNEIPACSIGDYMPAADFPNPRMQAKVVCSAHPAHMSGEDGKTLVWINSGFRHCGQTGKSNFDFKKDFEFGALYTLFKNLRDFAVFYSGALTPKVVLLPPFSIDGGVPNDDDEPANFWEMTGYCNNYLWCAYSRVGGKVTIDGETVDKTIKGQIFELDEDQTKNFAEVASYWLEDLPWEDTKDRFNGQEFDLKAKPQQDADQ